MAMYKDIYDLIEEKLDVKLRKNQITDMAVLHNILLIHVSFSAMILCFESV